MHLIVSGNCKVSFESTILIEPREKKSIWSLLDKTQKLEQ